jgi:cytochrome c oxidase cbb3-type subunit 3
MSAEKPHGVVHEYDGIIEEDNQLPRWWLYTLYATVVFALGYWAFYEAFGNPGPLDQYRAERVAERRAEAQRLMAMGAPTDELLVEMAKNPAIVAQGAEIYASTCASCHLASGGGQIGPNLTDEYWLHGGAPTAILKTVRDGVVDKGMLAWGPMLGEEKVRAVTAYLITLKDTNVPGGKPPQGDKLATIEGAAPAAR